ncbi:MAG: exo-alpha-sialidase [Clostridia bacterium]|nr:exo-alpha-sialidase [Clostridia bacterium]
MEFKTVFGPGTGGPSDYYRIPSMVTTKNGTVVACADARFYTGADNPNRIDKVVRRSFDSGETWEDYIIAVQEHGTEKNRASAAIDPILTYVSETGRIYMHYCHTPAGIGILNCKCGVGENPQGNKIIEGKFGKRYILKDGMLYTKSGKASAYKVNDDGDVSENGKLVGNIYTGGDFRAFGTSTLMMCYSDDDGLTWSKPRSLNTQVKKKFMSFIGPGPGNGIVIKNGKYKGRIVVPVYYGTKKWPLCLSCCVIYSDDNGESWQLGETPNNTRKIKGFKANHFLISHNEMLTESQVIEQSDGTLKYFMRNHNPKRCVAVAYSKNGGASWENFSLDESLPQPVCQSSVIKIENADKPYVVLLNPADRKERKCGTVRLSEDDGETFTYSRVLKEDDFVYSSLTLLPDGNIGALFEPDKECKNILFTKFSLDWIKGNDN